MVVNQDIIIDHDTTLGRQLHATEDNQSKFRSFCIAHDGYCVIKLAISLRLLNTT